MNTDNNPSNPFLRLVPESRQRLQATASLPQAGHLWSKGEINALIFAYAARRPLLVRGEAGSGKSQIGRAAASILNDARLFVEVIHPRFEALDLLYRIDAVQRLADAQLKNELDRSNRKYVRRGLLWQALEYAEAGRDAVMLIDEIDKADSDVPNALLEVLGNRSFTVPALNHQTVQARGDQLPLIIITTNEERELPAAFVRRCAVLNLNPPENEMQFRKWLVERGRVHFQPSIHYAEESTEDEDLIEVKIENDVLEQCAQRVWRDRQAAVAAGYPTVGLAEYIDLLTALDELTRHIGRQAERKEQQKYWLTELGDYALIKNAGQSQGRSGATRE